MALSAADYWAKVGQPGNATSLASPGHTIGGTSFTVDSTSLWPTDTKVTFGIDTVTLVNGVQTRVANSYTVWDGVVASATTITGCVKRYGTDQNYSAGSTTRVYILPTSVRENKIIDGIRLFANDDATLKTTAVRAALNLDAGTSTGWTVLGATASTVTALGNRSYSAVFNGIDLTSTVSPGMRLRTTRTVAAPTQCTSLNGTTQYYTKASPAGMAQTDSITEEVWIKPTAYQQGILIARANGTTDGWNFYMNASGQIVLGGARAADDLVNSYQSVPLNKWTHVAASINSAGTTGAVYFDGVLVPSAYTNNANSGFLAPTGSLSIGATSAGASPFAGKIAQVGMYSAVLSAATILASFHQTLTGSETSLISAYSFNGASGINDLNVSNANNLTANGSAVATNADSPYGGQADGTISSILDYCIITKTAFSTNTTVTVQVPEGCTIPTSGGVSAVGYSTQRVPYGFPSQQSKWELNMRIVGSNVSASVGGVWAAITGTDFLVPLGAWKLRGSIVLTGSCSTTATFAVATQWDNTSPSVNRENNDAHRANVTTTFLVARHHGIESIVEPTAITYKLYAVITSGASTQLAYLESAYSNNLTLENAYL